MDEARNYIDTISRGLKAWDYWAHNGNTIIADVGTEKYLYVIQSETDIICKLDANKVKDEILERKDGISFRIERIEEYGLLPLLQYLEDFLNTKVILDDEDVSNAINTYFLRIYGKANDLCRVMAEAEHFIPSPKHPVIQKALSNPILLDIFYDRPDVLENYINFCLAPIKPSHRARKAKELANDRKMKYEYINSRLREELEKIGIDVGSYKTWQGAANKA